MPRATQSIAAYAAALLALTAAAGCSSSARSKLQGPPTPEQVEAFWAKRVKTTREPLSLFPVHQLWTVALNNQLAAPPAYQGARGFFPIEGDRIVCYALADGALQWTSPGTPLSRPAASEDLHLLFFPEAGSIQALRISDGTVAWKIPFAEALAAPLAYDNAWLVAVTSDAQVVALRASDGHIVWRSRIKSPAHASPTLADDRVYIPAEDGRVIALRIDTGAEIWTRPLGGAPSEILALGDRLYVGSKDNRFYSLKTEDGSIDWPVTTGADVVGMPVADERNVYFVSLDNVLRAVHRSNGNQEWKQPLKLRPSSGPVAAGDVVIVSGLSKLLPAYKTDKGMSAGDLGVLEDVAAPPYALRVPGIAGTVVIIVTTDITKGATITAEARTVEPLASPVAELPDAVLILPNGTVMPKPKSPLP